MMLKPDEYRAASRFLRGLGPDGLPSQRDEGRPPPFMQPQFWTTDAKVYMTNENQEELVAFLQKCGAVRVRLGTVPSEPRVCLDSIPHLDFSGCRVQHVEGPAANGRLLARLLGNEPPTESLSFSGNRAIGEFFFGVTFPRLSSLNLDGTLIEDEDLAIIRLRCPSLAVLFISGCRNLTLECLDHLTDLRVTMMGYLEGDALHMASKAFCSASRV